MKKESRFYVLIILGFIIAMTGLLSPPLGIIHNSVLIAVGCFLTVAGGVIGAHIVFDFKNLYFYIGNRESIKDDYGRQENPMETNKNNNKHENKPEKTETGQTHSARQ